MMAKKRQHERLISFVDVSIWGHFPLAMPLPPTESHVPINASTSGGRRKYNGVFALKSVCIIFPLYKEEPSVNSTILASLTSSPPWISIYEVGPQEDLTYLPWDIFSFSTYNWQVTSWHPWFVVPKVLESWSLVISEGFLEMLRRPQNSASITPAEKMDHSRESPNSQGIPISQVWGTLTVRASQLRSSCGVVHSGPKLSSTTVTRQRPRYHPVI